MILIYSRGGGLTLLTCSEENKKMTREYFRIKYPEQIEKPKFIINRTYYDILDISENGVKFLCDIYSKIDFKKNQEIKGITKLRTNQILSLEGKVKRIKNKGVFERVCNFCK